ncbi:hypothetical protein EC957_011913 [Mortierella hygrophila]|uniref:F-actin-capping protein subunit beta n=1 Tax=Mortierella hygrophila TaxID=979708 RepID=A0A9P6F7Z5_9FUNG|nr:hypothetical protein EC957_011913 [Mortierella hygrophila]
MAPPTPTPRPAVRPTTRPTPRPTPAPVPVVPARPGPVTTRNPTCYRPKNTYSCTVDINREKRNDGPAVAIAFAAMLGLVALIVAAVHLARWKVRRQVLKERSVMEAEGKSVDDPDGLVAAVFSGVEIRGADGVDGGVSEMGQVQAQSIVQPYGTPSYPMPIPNPYVDPASSKPKEYVDEKAEVGGLSFLPISSRSATPPEGTPTRTHSSLSLSMASTLTVDNIVNTNIDHPATTNANSNVPGPREERMLADQEQQLDCALDLMRRLPPQNTEENLASLMTLLPDLHEDLLSSIDQPLKVQTCAKSGKEYLLCDYNRDSNSYRSPWSNEFSPPLADATYPSAKLRKLEIAANDAFDTYRELYFEGGVSSAYFWDLEDGAFAGVVLIKKIGDGKGRAKGAWDSIHIFEAQEKARNAHYKLTSTVMLYMLSSKNELGDMNLSGSMTRQAEMDGIVDDPSMHIANIGRMIEDMETKMRHLLKDVYFGKTKDTVNDLRSIESLAKVRKQQELQREIASKLQARQQ